MGSVALGAALAVGLLALGFGLGRCARPLCPEQRTTPLEDREEESRELREQQRAFEGMLSYNADVAYGLDDRGGWEM